MKQRNKISAQQSFLLYKWLEQNEQTVKEMTYEKIARKATKEIGFFVTVSNIQGAFRVTKIEKIQRPQTINKSVTKPKQTDDYESTLNYRKIRSLTRAFITLCKELGHTPKNIDYLMKITEYE